MYETSISESASSPAVFSRGVKLATSGQVLSATDQTRQDGSVLVSARVRGSGNSTYDVNVVFDPESESIRGYTCTCPAHEQYPGMCKHAVATALLYGLSLKPAGKSDAQSRVESPASAKRSRTGAPRPAAKPAPKPAAKPQVRTSVQIENVVRSYADRSQRDARLRATRAQQQAAPDESPAELICTIAKGADAHRNSYYYGDDGMWRLGLKVSRGKASYVVKHIDEVVQAWRSGVLYSYGKNLAFVHRPGAFTAHANRLLELLAGIVDAQRSMFDMREQRNYYYSNGKLSTKTLPLLPAQLIDILDLEIGNNVIYEYTEEQGGFEDRYGYHHRGKEVKRKVTVNVVDEDPPLEVTIAPREGGGGYDLSISPAETEYLPGEAGRAYLVNQQGVYRLSQSFARDLGPFCANVLPASSDLQIGQDSMPAFCAAALPALRAHVKLDEPADLDSVMPPEAQFSFHIGREEGAISCNAVARYGDERVGLFDDARKNDPVRDVAREMAAQAVVREFFPHGANDTPSYELSFRERYGYSSYGYGTESDFGGHVYGGGYETEAPDPFFDEDDDEAYYALFHDGLSQLSELGEVFLSERLKRVSVRPSPSVRVEATLSDGKLDLRADSSELSNEELMAYLASYKRKQRFVRLENGDILRIDGAISQVAELADSLGLDAEALVEGEAELPANKTLFVDAMLKRAGGIRFSRNEAFRKIVRDFETVDDADMPVPTDLRAQMRPYQEEGYRWLCVLGKTGFGGILADDMGLGKTLQAIAYFLHAVEEGETRPALVVCPASLVYNWIAELSRFAPTLRASAVLGTKGARRELLADASSCHVLVTSYDLLKRDVDLYEGHEFSCCLLDEAQYIKNANTKAAKSAKEIDARVHFALTGTPIENRLSELWSIFEFLMPGVLGTQEQFARRFSTPIGNGDEACAKRLQALVGPFILRRLKGDVLTDLPEKNESIVYAQMEGEQSKLYKANASKLARSLTAQLPEEFQSSKLQVLAELTRLRQIACDPRLAFDNYTGPSAKLDTAIELIANAVEGGHSLLVFSQFTSMFALVEERLEKQGIPYLELTGATSKEERVRLVKRFQAKEAPVFLISLKAGGVGLNLTAADIVIHYDPWWNLAAQNQATDRAHRIGQEREVSVFKLIAKDTIEERIVEMQEAKQGLADSVIGGEAVSAASITRDDILALLEADE